MTVNYRQINYQVMTDTKYCYESMPELISAVNHSISGQFMVAEEDNIDEPWSKMTEVQWRFS